MDDISGTTKLVQVRLEDDMIKTFESLKSKLKFKNDTEVLRHAIVFTEKRITK